MTVDAVASSSHSAHKMYAAIELRFPFQMAHLQLIPSLWGCVKLASVLLMCVSRRRYAEESQVDVAAGSDPWLLVNWVNAGFLAKPKCRRRA